MIIDLPTYAATQLQTDKAFVFYLQTLKPATGFGLVQNIRTIVRNTVTNPELIEFIRTYMVQYAARHDAVVCYRNGTGANLRIAVAGMDTFETQADATAAGIAAGAKFIVNLETNAVIRINEFELELV